MPDQLRLGILPKILKTAFFGDAIIFSMVGTFAKVVMLLILVMASIPSFAKRPRIGLVLGGGGARGIAHVGVIKVLEENRIPVDCIVGTSIGSLVGGSYAAGRTPKEMQERIEAANWNNMFYAQAPRQSYPFRRKQDDALSMIGVEVGLADNGALKLPFAAISTQDIQYFLRSLTFGGTVTNFDELGIPYRAVATDLISGDMVVLKDGDIVTAMRASMAVPGVFPSVPSKGRILVDGGLVRNLPVDVARKLCADVVIAVDVGSAPLSKDEITSLFSVADQYTRLMMIQNVKPQIDTLTRKDVLISPVFSNLGSMDFAKGEALVNVGQKAALKMLPELQRYSVSEAEYVQWAKERDRKRLGPKPIKSVTVEKSGWVNGDVLKNELHVQTGQPLNMDDLHRRLTELYATGDFSQLDYQLLDNHMGQDLTILPIQKSWGPNYLGVGLSLGTDFDNSYPWNLTVMYRRTWINSYGADWKTVFRVGNSSLVKTEFFQPMSAGGYAFVSPYFRYYRIPLALWQDGSETAEYKYHKISVGGDIGTGSKFGEIRFGPVYNNYNATRSIGSNVLPESDTHDYGLRLNLFYDQLDNYFFPSAGTYFDLYGYRAFGGSEELKDYGLYGFNFKDPFMIGTGSLVVTLKGQTSTGENKTLADVSWLGGFLNLSSWHYQELIGDQYLYGSLQYLHHTGLLSGSYWGLALESGRMFNYFDRVVADRWHYSTTGYFAYDSVIGPMYLALAWGDNHNWSGYFMLGKQF